MTGCWPSSSSSIVSGGGFMLSNSNSASTVAVRFAVWISRRISSLCDHWLGTLIPEPYYQRRFSGDRLTLRLSFRPFTLCAITDPWAYFRFWVALAWMWGVDGLLAFIILFDLVGRWYLVFTLSNSNSATTVAGRICPWLDCSNLPVQSLI